MVRENQRKAELFIYSISPLEMRIVVRLFKEDLSTHVDLYIPVVQTQAMD